MNQDKLFHEITILVNEVTKDAAALDAKRAKLRELTRQWSGADSASDVSSAPKKKRAKRGSSAPVVNVSDAVKALVSRETGLSVPMIMDRLGLRGHEAAVRSALKKAKDKTIVSVQGRWYPIAPNPPQTEKAPTIKSEPEDEWSVSAATLAQLGT